MLIGTCTLVLYPSERMQPLAGVGMLIISTSIKSQLWHLSNVVLGSSVSQVNRELYSCIKEKLSFEYNFKEIFKGMSLKTQIGAHR